MQSKLHIAGARLLLGLAENIRDSDQRRRLVSDKLRSHAIAGVHREPMQSRELFAKFTRRVFQPNRIAVAAMDDKHAESVERYLIGLALGVRLHLGRRDGRLDFAVTFGAGSGGKG